MGRSAQCTDIVGASKRDLAAAGCAEHNSCTSRRHFCDTSKSLRRGHHSLAVRCGFLAVSPSLRAAPAPLQMNGGQGSGFSAHGARRAIPTSMPLSPVTESSSISPTRMAIPHRQSARLQPRFRRRSGSSSPAHSARRQPINWSNGTTGRAARRRWRRRQTLARPYRHMVCEWRSFPLLFHSSATWQSESAKRVRAGRQR